MVQQALRLLRCGGDPQTAVFICKISGFLSAYGTGYPFLSFYIVEADATVQAVLCLYEGVCLVAGRPDPDELSFFLGWRGEVAVLQGAFDTLLPLRDFHRLPEARLRSGALMRAPALPGATGCSLDRCEPSPFTGFLRAHDLSFPPDPHQTLYCDLSHRVRHGITRLYSFVPPDQSKQAGVCACLFADETLRLLGALCIRRDLRGRGYARQLTTSFRALPGPQVYLLCGDGYRGLYLRCGFSEAGRWGELRLADNPRAYTTDLKIAY